MAKPTSVGMDVRRAFCNAVAAKGMTLTQLAKKLGVHDTTVFKPLRGKEGMSEAKLRKFCDAADVDFYSLTGVVERPAEVTHFDTNTAYFIPASKQHVDSPNGTPMQEAPAKVVKKSVKRQSTNEVTAWVQHTAPMRELMSGLTAVVKRLRDFADSASRYGYA